MTHLEGVVIGLDWTYKAFEPEELGRRGETRGHVTDAYLGMDPVSRGNVRPPALHIKEEDINEHDLRGHSSVTGEVQK